MDLFLLLVQLAPAGELKLQITKQLVTDAALATFMEQPRIYRLRSPLRQHYKIVTPCQRRG